MKFKKSLLVAAFSVLAPSAYSATLLVDEDFSYTDGSLVGNTPTPGPGGTWVTHSGTVGDLLVTGGQAVVQHGVPSEDANIGFTSQTSEILKATFDITVNDDSVVAGSDFEYFAHFSDGGTSNFFARLDIVPAFSTGSYDLGIATVASTAEATLGGDFAFGDTISVTLTYDFSTGLASVSANSLTATSTSSVIATNLSAFALRQSDSSNNETILVDNLVITSVPEPTVALLGAFGLLGLVRRRR